VNFSSKTQLSNQNLIYFNELKVKHLKTIYKCLLGEEIDKDILFYNLSNILNELTKEEVSNLNFVDYFILLLEIRILSIGNSIKIQIQENTTLEVNLMEVLNSLQNFELFELLQPENYDNKIKIYYRLPNILEVCDLYTNQHNLIYFFLDKIVIDDVCFELKKNPNIEKIVNSLPAKIFAKIHKKIQSFVNYFNGVNLLSYNPHIKDATIYFNLNIKNLCLIVKLLFGDHLMALYENIFALCKLGNFTPEYIENCSPGEYLLYVKKLEEISKPKNEHQMPHSLEPDLFGDTPIEEPLNPYESSNLPPITSQFTG
jgi:hypothetical protein